MIVTQWIYDSMLIVEPNLIYWKLNGVNDYNSNTSCLHKNSGTHAITSLDNNYSNQEYMKQNYVTSTQYTKTYQLIYIYILYYILL